MHDNIARHLAGLFLYFFSTLCCSIERQRKLKGDEAQLLDLETTAAAGASGARRHCYCCG